MRMTVLYYSKTGNTLKMAEAIATGMQSIAKAEAKSFSIERIDEDWLKTSKCVVVGSPIYMASVSGKVKEWLEGPCLKYGLSGKLGGAFATSDYIHGGGELGIRTILDHMMVLGMLTFSGGGAFVKPVIHLGPVAINKNLEASRELFEIYGKRMASEALKLFTPTC